LVSVVVTRISDDRVVVAVDPHKASWTAAAVDGSLQPLATVRVPVSRDGYRALRRFAHRWPHARWAIEGAAGVGAPLTTLRAANIRAELLRQCTSVGWLAYALGMSHSALTQRLDGVVSFDTDDLEAIADHLGVGIAALIAAPR
jgi:hypothetical protein